MVRGADVGDWMAFLLFVGFTTQGIDVAAIDKVFLGKCCEEGTNSCADAYYAGCMSVEQCKYSCCLSSSTQLFTFYGDVWY
ncbi:hypothetical protein VFPPC_02561 [Pochonia chlamydosporia 170]|uniref:Uncharacterized protein n=1 Tax=Pochonia chlamydosporia 170 TaxID=1380566 RepID=A0A179FWN3_METCM|nr:hypothetical protein VFPPC_02561 [Pochonia chlamydosporia 170]OAQ70022.1 hypothetical protein VFPPC_02561 [Pochonia chlamydosporia 170]